MPSLILLLAILALVTGTTPAQWQPAPGPLATRWTAEVDPAAPLPEYPRPQLVREEWRSLNGLWQFALTGRNAPRPGEWRGRILVPFAIESSLSGVGERVGPEERLWYRRTFRVPDAWNGRRLRLHFGAVDWETVVWVDGQKVGEHRGGYDPFTFDIGHALDDRAEHELVVAVWDPSDRGVQPFGKQTVNPRGIWYTPVTGIWQTVWLEPVPEVAIEGLDLRPSLAGGTLTARVSGPGDAHTVELVALRDGEEVARVTGRGAGPHVLAIPEPIAWSPESPELYDLAVRLREGDRVVDEVASYFALRDVGLVEGDDGVTRLALNGEPRFMLGTLDQGYWPDGLYTAPTDAALRYDLEVTQRLGFDTVRKHVKVEPSRWYHWCDRLGLLVWQDMPNGDRRIGRDDPDIERSAQSARQFERELRDVIGALRNHPSVVMWVPFNEGWGQYDTARIAGWIAGLDPTRLVDCPSGWADRGVGDVHDVHRYPGPGMPATEPGRAAVLGEFGGLGLPVDGHLWQDRENWGYRSYDSAGELEDAYVDLMTQARWLHARGLAAAIYTQTTDVEIEVNGLMTYDRAVVKMDEVRVREANLALRRTPPRLEVLVESSREHAQEWHYTLAEPAAGWRGRGFETAGWRVGPGGFGTAATPGAVARTVWETDSIWLRRTFTLTEDVEAEQVALWLHHDEDVRVWIDGVLAAEREGHTTGYRLVPIRPEARELLTAGDHVLAVHCRQTRGGQYIDTGLLALR